MRARVYVAALGAALLSAVPAPSASAADIIHRKLIVAAINDDWTRTGLTLEPGQLVVIMAQGEAKVRSYGDAIGPAGLDNGAGRLEGKVGQAPPILIGKSTAFYATEKGVLKVRIKDTNYSDNVGGYTVHILILPPGTVPEATDVPTESQ